MALPRWAAGLFLGPATVLTACFIVRSPRVESLDLTALDTVRVRSPVKAHLIDGSTVVYRNGVLLAGGVLSGAGVRYDLTLTDSAEVLALPLDSVVGMEAFRTSVNAGATIGFSTLATVGAIGVTVAVACAVDPKCFGSCPTYYSDSAGTPVLEAEGFSYSIAPLFEARDVDRLRARPQSDGRVRLEVRNEAFETHYLNHLELLEVLHAADEVVVPDPRGLPLAVGVAMPPLQARDRHGRDVTALLRAADGLTYRSPPERLRGATLEDLRDHVDLWFPAPPAGDSVALLLRLRNSLLNTVLLYDVMLGDPGARSLDWQAENLARVGPALAVGTWYAKHMGLRVAATSQAGGEVLEEVDRVRDTGPVAWKDVAVVLPVPTDGPMRVRLDFVVDNWRIDRVALATGVRKSEVRAIPLARVVGARGEEEPEALASLLTPDGRYLQTSPGQRFIAEWEPEPRADSVAQRTFLLASQGYYSEWVRRGWLAAPRDTVVFTPSDEALFKAIRRWIETQDALEVRFHATRVPVR